MDSRVLLLLIAITAPLPAVAAGKLKVPTSSVHVSASAASSSPAIRRTGAPIGTSVLGAFNNLSFRYLGGMLGALPNNPSAASTMVPYSQYAATMSPQIQMQLHMQMHASPTGAGHSMAASSLIPPLVKP